jgi:hypothetical protein
MSDLNTNKVLQAINLSPPLNENFFDKLEKMHPMRQIVYATILQIVVFGSMMLIFYLLHLLLG